MASPYQVSGSNPAAPFSLKLHRGEGMVMLAMNWLGGQPPETFVGFAIEYREPDGDVFYPLKNRLNFSYPEASPNLGSRSYSTREAPIQSFRWTHFPYNAHLPGTFTYRVTPVFMDDVDTLNFGEAQSADIVLSEETYPGQLNVAFTRGYIASQAFADFYAPVETLLPPNVGAGLTFAPTNPNKDKAYAWMGFEARRAILQMIDDAIADPEAKVSMIAYDFNLPEIIERLKQLGSRLRLIIDDNTNDHGKAGSPEDTAQATLTAAGAAVIRQHMSALQHNKVIIVDGPKGQKAVCGSTNFSWNGFFVQSNNAIILTGPKAIAPFQAAFETYWKTPGDFPSSPSATWTPIDLDGLDVQVAFSSHSAANAVMAGVAADIRTATSSVFYSLAFLNMIHGELRDAIDAVTNRDDLFTYGMSDKKTGIVLENPSGHVDPVYYAALTKNVPEPFKTESTTNGIHLHHKFVVIDFNLPSARVYMGSHNFSTTADRSNGENILCLKDARIATAYMVEAVSMFDHYRFNIIQSASKSNDTVLTLKKPPRQAGDVAWWQAYYTDAVKSQDRQLFA